MYKAGGKSVSVQVGDKYFYNVQFRLVADDVLEVEVDGVKERIQFFEDAVERELHLLFKNGEIATLAEKVIDFDAMLDEGRGGRVVRSPMPGTIVKLFSGVGEAVLQVTARREPVRRT